MARSVAAVPGRDVTENARLLAVAAMAMDDALIAVFDAKYTYNFWRPVTAIRNAEGDAARSGLDAVHRHADASRVSVRPLHRVRRRSAPCSRPRSAPARRPKLSSASSTAGGAVRTWTSVDDFVHEVAVARIYDGVHYRNSTEVGTAMGKKIGELAVTKIPRATR